MKSSARRRSKRPRADHRPQLRCRRVVRRLAVVLRDPFVHDRGHVRARELARGEVQEFVLEDGALERRAVTAEVGPVQVDAWTDQVPALRPVDARGRERDERREVERGLEDARELVDRGWDHEHDAVFAPRVRPALLDGGARGLGYAEHPPCRGTLRGMEDDHDAVVLDVIDGAEVPEVAVRLQRDVLDVVVGHDTPAVGSFHDREEDVLGGVEDVVAAEADALLDLDDVDLAGVLGAIRRARELRVLVLIEQERVVPERQRADPPEPGEFLVAEVGLGAPHRRREGPLVRRPCTAFARWSSSDRTSDCHAAVVGAGVCGRAGRGAKTAASRGARRAAHVVGPRAQGTGSGTLGRGLRRRLAIPFHQEYRFLGS